MVAAALAARPTAAHPAALYLGGATGFGLYVHWPFCRSKCPYCDFNSHVAGEAIDQARWAAAYAAELAHQAQWLGAQAAERPQLTSIFFGGGTPSLMAPATCAAILEAAARAFQLAPDLEVTLEANPTSVEAARLAGFKAAGVNRLSLGVQALDDDALRWLGREHDQATALAAIDQAARLFERYSFDLIYARPGQTVAAWRTELARALALAGGHLSVYQLTIEPGTRFHQLQAQGRLTLPDDALQAALYEATRDDLTSAGLPAYEISNHARPGEACRHNLTYWRGGDYLGIGPGAHGRLTRAGQRQALATRRMPRAWLGAVEQAGHAIESQTALPPAEQALELLLTGLRLAEGVPVDRLTALAGRPLAQLIDPAALAMFLADGFLQQDAGRLRATATGQQCLNALLARLVSL